MLLGQSSLQRRVTLITALSAVLLASLPALPQDPPSGKAPPSRGPAITLIEFRDLPLADALRLLAAQTDVNVVATTRASAVMVSLNLRGVSLFDALDVLCQAHGLRWRRDPATAIIQVAVHGEWPDALSTAVQLGPNGKVSISARAVPLSALLMELAERTGRSIVLAPEIGERPITLTVNQLDAPAAIQAVCRAAGVQAEVDAASGVIRVQSGAARPEITVVGKGEAQRVSLAVREAPLGDVLREFAAATGLSVAPSTDAAKKSVTLFVTDVSPRAALDALARAHNLWLRYDAATGITRIHTVDEYRRDVTSFREDRIEVFTLLFANAMEVALAVRDLFGDRVVLSVGREEDQELASELSRRLSRFDQFDSRSQGFGANSNAGSSATGGRNVGVDQRGTTSDTGGSTTTAVRNADLLRQQQPQLFQNLTPEEIDALEGNGDPAVLSRLMVRHRTTVFMTVSRRLNRIIARSGDDEMVAQIRALIPQLDLPTPLVLLEVKVLAIELGDGLNTAFDWQAGRGEFSSSFASGEPSRPSAGSLTPGGSGLNSSALVFQYVGEAFRTRLQFLETKNRVTALATPLLMTANNEVSRLFVGEERPINRSFTGPQTLVNNGGNTTTPGTTEIEFRPVGTTLLITPSIASDRTVTLRILQETSSIRENGARVLVPTNTGFISQPVDIVQSRSVSGTIVAQDGLCVALGGLIEERIVRDIEQIPLLGEIPLLGLLFQRHVDKRSRTELVVLVRPYVLNTPAEAERASRDTIAGLSLHPNAPNGHGTLDAFGKDEVPRSAKSERQEKLRGQFRFHSLDTGDGKDE